MGLKFRSKNTQMKQKKRFLCGNNGNSKLFKSKKSKNESIYLTDYQRHYKIFCVNGNTGFKFESRIFYFIHLQNEEDYEKKESRSA